MPAECKRAALAGGLAEPRRGCYTLARHYDEDYMNAPNPLEKKYDSAHVGRVLDFSGLMWVHKFGYLRLQELGLLLYTNPEKNKYQYQYAVRLAVKWREKKLVIQRILPDNAGTVLVLSRKGADFLLDAGFDDAKTGKDIGAIDNEKWIPPNDWKHHVIATSLLTRLRYDYLREIVTEYDIKRFNSRERICDKMPDGLYRDIETKKWIAVEIESARKTGPEMKRLIKSIIAASAGKRIVSGKQIDCVAIAYDRAASDERGYTLDHRKRVINAIKKEADRDITLKFINCELSNLGVKNYVIENCIVEADYVSGHLARMEWRKRADEQVAIDDAGFEYRVTSDGHAYAEPLDSSDSSGGRLSATDATVTAAKRACAAHALAARTV